MAAPRDPSDTAAWVCGRLDIAINAKRQVADAAAEHPETAVVITSEWRLASRWGPVFQSGEPAPLGEVERRQLMQLGTDLALAWSHPAATSATRKRIVRATLSEIVVRVEAEHIEMILHWQGGDHTALKVKKNGAGKHRWTIPEDTLSLVRELARLMPDRQIARLLNRAGKPTGRGNGWTQARVCSFRSHYGIAVHRESEWAERGEITLEAAAQIMDVSVMTALRMVRHGIIKGLQFCRGAPWVIKAEDVAAYRALSGRATLSNVVR